MAKKSLPLSKVYGLLVPEPGAGCDGVNPTIIRDIHDIFNPLIHKGSLMRETTGNLWEFHEKEAIVCITTNGAVSRHGRAQLRRGCTLQGARVPRAASTMLKGAKSLRLMCDCVLAGDTLALNQQL